MQSRTILVISIFMTVSLLGVIGLQAFWLNKTMDQASDEFDQRAKRALYATVGNIAQTELEVIITEEIDNAIDWRNLLRDSSSFSNGALPEELLYFQTFESESSLHIAGNGSTVVHVGTGDSVESSFIQRIEIIEEDNREAQTTYELFEQDFDVIEEAFKTVLVKGISNQDDMGKRLQEAQIDSVLKSELKKEGIDLPFVYAVSADTVFSAFSSSSNLENMLFNASIFNSSEDSPLLHLGFETRGAYILKNTGDILALVLLFTILLMGTTIYAIRFMFNQKRLADMKSDFINNMTHEFKTPLATIGLAADSIKHPKVQGNEGELDRYSNIIVKESHRLNSHVESILQLARMERGEINLKKSVVQINDLMHDALAANRMRIERSSAEISENYLEVETACVVDPYHLVNALSNLIDNAIKYSKGIPQVSIHVKSKTGFISFAVSDKGIGMSEDAQKKAFEPFYREQMGNLHDVKGFGVGLSYVKEIAESHGGSVELESKKGKGTTVTMKIPYNEG